MINKNQEMAHFVLPISLGRSGKLSD